MCKVNCVYTFIKIKISKIHFTDTLYHFLNHCKSISVCRIYVGKHRTCVFIHLSVCVCVCSIVSESASLICSIKTHWVILVIFEKEKSMRNL